VANTLAIRFRQDLSANSKNMLAPAQHGLRAEIPGRSPDCDGRGFAPWAASGGDAEALHFVGVLPFTMTPGSAKSFGTTDGCRSNSRWLAYMPGIQTRLSATSKFTWSGGSKAAHRNPAPNPSSRSSTSSSSHGPMTISAVTISQKVAENSAFSTQSTNLPQFGCLIIFGNATYTLWAWNARLVVMVSPYLPVVSCSNIPPRKRPISVL